MRLSNQSEPRPPGQSNSYFVIRQATSMHESADGEPRDNPTPDFDYDSFDDERETPEIARLTMVEVAEIHHGSIISRARRNPIMLRTKSKDLSPISSQHIRFRCFEGIWAVEDLGSTSGIIVNGIYIQGRSQSGTSGGSSKRSFSTSV